ncbi:uncharacterized protein [Centruroides vittatus]|uniref:uncharacterized protein n=1 Tax=Centruroides vittatus TaxID=120091 RepID=UPI00350EB30D
MKKDDIPVVRGILVATLVAALIFIMFCVFVVYGAVKDRRGFLLPWVIVMSIEVAIQIISLFAIIVVVATRKEAKDIASGVIVILSLIFSVLFQIYCIICVHSHYQLLGQTSSNPPSYAVKM